MDRMQGKVYRDASPLCFFSLQAILKLLRAHAHLLPITRSEELGDLRAVIRAARNDTSLEMLMLLGSPLSTLFPIS